MSLLTDLEKMDTDLKQVRTDTNVALTEKGGTEVQNLNEIAEAVRGLPSGGGGGVINIESKIKDARFFIERSVFPENSQINVYMRVLAWVGAPVNFQQAFSQVKTASNQGVVSLKLTLDQNNEVLSCADMFTGSLWENIDLEGVKNKIRNSSGMFSNNNYLVNILGELDLSGCTDASKTKGMFASNFALQEVRFKAGTIPVSLSLNGSDKLSPESVQSIIDGLATVTTPQTITLHKNIVLTAEQKETIRTKGWTLAQ